MSIIPVVRKLFLLSLLLPLPLFGQALNYTPPAIVLVDSGGNFFPSGSGTALNYAPPVYACYTNVSGQYVPCVFSGGGGSITLTTTGTSGAATLTGSVLNIPVYSGGSSYPDITDTSGTVGINNATAAGVTTINMGVANTTATSNLVINEGGQQASGTTNGQITTHQIWCDPSQSNCFSVGTRYANGNSGIFVVSPGATNGVTVSSGELVGGSLTVNTHIAGGGTAPTVAAGAGAGTSPTVSLTNAHDIAFQLNLTTGTSTTASAVLATVTFTNTWATPPHCQWTPKTAASALAATQIYLTETTTTVVFNVGATALTASTAYVGDVNCIQ